MDYLVAEVLNRYSDKALIEALSNHDPAGTTDQEIFAVKIFSQLPQNAKNFLAEFIQQ